MVQLWFWEKVEDGHYRVANQDDDRVLTCATEDEATSACAVHNEAILRDGLSSFASAISSGRCPFVGRSPLTTPPL